MLRSGLILAALALAGCGARTFVGRDPRPDVSSPDAPGDPDAVTPFDVPAPEDTAPDVVVPLEDVQPDIPQPQCVSDAECGDGVFCNGQERCVAGACVAGGFPCDDGASCTRDGCDEAAGTCVFVPDDSACDDRDACNGPERCAPRSPRAEPVTGCLPPGGPIIDCEDGDLCTVDLCAGGACVHMPRDLDGDGFVERMCSPDGRGDCNDSDPRTFPGAPEICDDRRDNNCDLRVDQGDSAACPSSNDTCASAFSITDEGGFGGSTFGFNDDYQLSCNPGRHLDAVYRLTLTEPRYVVIFTGVASDSGALAVRPACGGPDLACGPQLYGERGMPWGSVVRFPRLEAGSYYVIVETGPNALEFGLTVRLGPPE